MIRLVRHRQKYSEGLLESSEVSSDEWEHFDGDSVDENPIIRRRAFVFPDLADMDFTTLLGAEFICLNCRYPPAF